MIYFLLNLVLAMAYIVLTQDMSFLNLLIALVISYLITSLITRAAGQPGYFTRGLRLGRFGLYFIRILIKANLEVAWEIITPGFFMKPRTLRYPVAGLTDVQITMLASAITLTPGTLTADIDEDRRVLYIHCMYAGDRESAIAQLDELRHRMMWEVFNQR